MSLDSLEDILRITLIRSLTEVSSILVSFCFDGNGQFRDRCTRFWRVKG
jgi:hypothetical protein